MCREYHFKEKNHTLLSIKEKERKRERKERKERKGMNE